MPAPVFFLFFYFKRESKKNAGCRVFWRRKTVSGMWDRKQYPLTLIHKAVEKSKIFKPVNDLAAARDSVKFFRCQGFF